MAPRKTKKETKKDAVVRDKKPFAHPQCRVPLDADPDEIMSVAGIRAQITSPRSINLQHEEAIKDIIRSLCDHVDHLHISADPQRPNCLRLNAFFMAPGRFATMHRVVTIGSDMAPALADIIDNGAHFAAMAKAGVTTAETRHPFSECRSFQL